MWERRRAAEWRHSQHEMILKEVITMETQAESPIQLENKMNFDIPVSPAPLFPSTPHKSHGLPLIVSRSLREFTLHQAKRKLVKLFTELSFSDEIV